MKKRSLALISLALIISGAIIFFGCNSNGGSSSEGEVLSKQYCIACHKYPDPSLLTKAAWEKGVLPMMGSFADIYQDKDGSYKKLTPDMAMVIRDPAFDDLRFNITTEDWGKIVNYYLSHAPDSLLNTADNVTVDKLPFSLERSSKKTKAFCGMVSYDETTDLLFQSNFKDSLLNIYNSHLQLTDSLKHCNGAVDVTRMDGNANKGTYLVTQIGSFQPSKNKIGSIGQLTVSNGKVTGYNSIANDLYRPVQSVVADMNNDGKQDIVVAEFGWVHGGLSLFTNLGNGKYKKSTICDLPGAEKIYVDDINKDGRPDLWVLFAQAREGIYQFINKGNGQFEQKEVLTFPPVYGSTYFQLADLDNDGQKEIIYTCGDNGDYSRILKPYHGIYIFKKENNTYKQIFFKHLNGCFKAVPADINGDGKTDLVAISFFADYSHNPNSGIVYLQNNGNNNFTAITDTTFSNLGRWIAMDVKDIDHDGKPDIILGNMAMNPGNKGLMMKWMNGPEFIVLKNNFKKK